ncbi:NADP-dependent oxidoreductase domain-containing protein [Halteromyces radiatus]|uniref:NADP-dependent oxidoreductase domain-containing protein n=1 Tax=Halteromyces radiatus TaxID=101107 RepID=UPI00221EA969|nr:NADP-dependent oxidoreductase domain-containing protein [Halteromyces radiatus]KAI8076362.1 NADP-dependent oxidoreductase domain-containing protein [Halteromyces radiatus]
MSAENLPPMKYVKFGNTGLRVSQICLGCMSFGSSDWFNWVLDEKESIDMIRKAYEAGINFFDTANVYSAGESERVLGKAIKELNMPRGRIVVATKVFCHVPEKLPAPLVPTPYDKSDAVNQFGLSRKHIFDSVEASLKRLQLDYIDLYQIHRADPNTPWEETMEALNDLVRSGKVRYIGASSMKAYEFQKANTVAEKNGWTKFISMQNLYNLLYREEEREMIPYCLDANIAGIPYCPLAGGYLTGKNRNTKRSDHAVELLSRYVKTTSKDDNEVIIDQVIAIAEKRGVSPAQIALAWNLSKPFVTSPILGFSKEKYLYEAIHALEIKLTDEEIQQLESAYVPRYSQV